jgi:hypothetical protein
MTRDAVLDLFDRLNVWSRGDQRAPHKPLSGEAWTAWNV